MDILQAAVQLRPGTAWSTIGNLSSADAPLVQAEDGSTRVTVPTPAELATMMASDTTPAAILTAQRAAAIAELLTDPSPNAKNIRGVLLLAMNEINLLRQWIEAFKAATAAASSLANLQTRVAALSAMPDRTAAQLKTAVQAIINAGTAD